LRVLVESKSEHGWLGTSCRYAPVEIAGDEANLGKLVDVVAGDRIGERLVGT
jgi:hypothetical protein